MAVFGGAYIMRNASVKVDGTEFANNLRKTRLVPSQDIQTYKTLIPSGTLQDVGNATWVWEIEGLQGAGGVAAAIRTAAATGDSMDIVVQAQPGSGKETWTFTVVALYLPVGGEEGSFQTFDVSLPVSGDPVFGTSA